MYGLILLTSNTSEESSLAAKLISSTLCYNVSAGSLDSLANRRLNRLDTIVANPQLNCVQKNFIVLISAELHYPSIEKFCLVLEGNIFTINLTLTVTLEVQGQIFILQQKDIIESGLHCQDFQVPSPGDCSLVVATVRFVTEGDVCFEESKDVVIRRIVDKALIQTDKPRYRPRDLVRCRIVWLDVNFLCSKIKDYSVKLLDPQGNCLYQWSNVNTIKCIADLSYKLTTEPILGTYTITVENGLAFKTFVVEEIVRPRCEIMIVDPVIIFAADPTFTVTVCGKYSYGKVVRGSLEIVLCRKQSWYYSAKYCITVSGKTDATGCFKTEINGCDLAINDPDLCYSNVEITADLTEDVTGIVFCATREVTISFVFIILKFQEMDSFYKCGHPYNITLLVQDRSGCALPFIMVSVEVTFEYHVCILEEITDDMGRAQFTLDTSEWKGQVQIRGYIRNDTEDAEKSDGTVTDVTHKVRPYYNEATSFLKLEPIYGTIPCGEEVHIRVKYNIIQSELRRYCRIIRFYYLFIGKKGIMQHGQITIIADENSPLYGCITVPIIFTPEFGPAPKMVGFILLRDGLVTADRLVFDVEKCFPNWASLKFSKKVALPKESLRLKIFSSAGSVCSIRAVDKSNNEDELSLEKLFDMLCQDSIRGGYPDIVDEDLYRFFKCRWPWYYYKSFIRHLGNDYVDVHSLFKDAGVKVLTNCEIVQPQKKLRPCSFPELFVPDAEKEPEMAPESFPHGRTDLGRKHLSEIWLFELVFIGDSDETDISVIAPDTITQFSARVFCVGDIGFGLSSDACITIFKPFVVNIDLPYSIVLGEILVLKVNVFNNLDYCIKILITLMSSQNFTVQGCQPPCVNSSCICPNGTLTFIWNITAITTGLIDIVVRVEAVASDEPCDGRPIVVPHEGHLDIVERKLLVKARGVPKEHAENAYICPNDTVPRIDRSFAVSLPRVWVENTQSASIVVMGDGLGLSLQNLDNLITMPYGCGEQNMITVCPMVSVLLYLDVTGQLTTTQRDTIISYLQDGYARQLQYKHPDGSFSVFGMSDPEGSTWLSALVVKCFWKAFFYMFIDINVINEALVWLGQQQQPDGCFIIRGIVIHTNMKGGVEDDVSHSCYLMTAFLEAGKPSTDPIVALGLSCLIILAPDITNPYTMALMAYTFALADDVATKQMLLNKLFLVAESSGDDLYWTYSLQNYQGTASVELSAYVVLALLTGSAITASDISKARRIVIWLIKQQSPQGGYGSTQDTVVAIQAVAKYMALTFNSGSSLGITVYNGKTTVATFRVDQTNRLVLQKSPLPNLPGKYRLLVEGNGCVHVQSVTKYNLEPVKVRSAFTIDFRVFGDWNSCIFTIVITVSYIGLRNVTNMVVIEMGMLSGFIIWDQTEIKLLKLDVVKKVSFQKGVFIIYLDELYLEEQHEFSISIKQEICVRALKPANIIIYDYYMPEENAETSYNVPDRNL
ncbi:alpha-2-macroglobulin-like protein 1 [Ranitomeya variabilis]|uniref:alpha-2-macroglobulin-like protein 1 n=1 Tax=Ranitomeya variabilis TaxID=490064 RepID=UPI004056AEF5